MRWCDMTSPSLAAAAASGAVVVLPVGSIEQHGPHLPVSTDSTIVSSLVERAVRDQTLDGAVVVAPTVEYGFSDDHLGFAGTLSLPARTLEDLLVEVGRRILDSGFARLVLVNGHGSNDRLLYYAIRRIRDVARRPVALAATTYWALAADDIRAIRRSGPGGMGHACELETSLMLHFRPETVRLELAVREIPEPYSNYRGTDLLGSSPVVAPDRWADRSRSGVTGDPLVATPQQGARFAEAIAARLGAFLQEFASWPLVDGGAR